MTDPLDDLKAAMTAATPDPDPERKTANVSLAEKNFGKIFASHQGSAEHIRLTPDRPTKGAGLFTGVKTMLSSLTTRPALTATTALVAVGLVVLIPTLRDGPPSLPGLSTSESGYEAAEPAPEPVLDGALGGLSATDSDDAPVLTRARPAPAREKRAAEAEIAPVMDSLAETPMVAPAAPNRVSKQVEIYAAEGVAQPRLDLRLQSESDIAPPPIDGAEVFANEAPNPVKVTAEEPVSTFSIDVDTASYSTIRSSLMNGYLPTPDAVRIEEMINYFPYDYAAPEPGEGPFKPTVTVTQTPWNPDTQLMHIALQGKTPAVEERPPLNLVFLIDTSGSMNQANKLPLLKQSFRLMLGQLDPRDEISIVTYAGSAGRVLDATPASERATIMAALDNLQAGGSTAGQQGLQQAYATAEAMAEDGEVTRVILATDGDFNVGLSAPEQLKTYIADKRDSGTYLSVLGFGRGNLDDATMQALAQNGNGQAAYIDTLSEAQKVLVDQLTGALFPIANDVKIQVEFNPNTVAEYRLIGYETRALAREDFNNDRVDAGEIGAGHTVTAIYELTPVGSPAVLNDPLRYTTADSRNDSTELGFLRLRYKEPGADTSQLIELPVTPDMGAVTAEVQFAAAIAGFGQLLRGSTYLGGWDYGDAIAAAEAHTGADAFGYRREALTLMRLAQSLSQ